MPSLVLVSRSLLWKLAMYQGDKMRNMRSCSLESPWLCVCSVAGIMWWRSRRHRRREQHKVVVLGGGFAGLTCAVELDSRGVSVDLVDEKQYFEYTPNIIPRLAGRDDHPLGRSYETMFSKSKDSVKSRRKQRQTRLVCSRHPSTQTWKALSDGECSDDSSS